MRMGARKASGTVSVQLGSKPIEMICMRRRQSTALAVPPQLSPKPSGNSPTPLDKTLTPGLIKSTASHLRARAKDWEPVSRRETEGLKVHYSEE